MRDTALADLSVRAGVPVWVVDYNPIGSSQIDSQTSNPCCQEEDEDIFVLEKKTQIKVGLKAHHRERKTGTVLMFTWLY